MAAVKRFDVDGPVLFEPAFFRDDRGAYVPVVDEKELAAHGIPARLVGVGFARNLARGTLRGLHYQRAPFTQGKLVRCTRGEVYDVAVDLRRGSPTFGRHVSATLSAENACALWVPPGFAHGYVTLVDASDVDYLFTHAAYSGEHGACLRWDDPALGIRWPVDKPSLNARDAGAPLLSQTEPL